jgi:hypothetical protein
MWRAMSAFSGLHCISQKGKYQWWAELWVGNWYGFAQRVMVVILLR